MFYYIKENGLCVYMTNNIANVNRWLFEHQKTIVSLESTIYHEITIEVK